MTITASIFLSLGVSALWAVIVWVAAYSIPAFRRIRPVLLALVLFLLAKDGVSYAADAAGWLPASDIRSGMYDFYRIVLGVLGIWTLVSLWVRARKGAGQKSVPQATASSSVTAPRLPYFPEVADDGSLFSRFQQLLLDRQLFLRPQLTLPDVADLLATNKTYLSKVVNDNYKVSFPELINTLRIDYAEQFILNNRGAKQEEVARACGFVSASSFNNTFKKVTGMPPKQWVTNWDASHRG